MVGGEKLMWEDAKKGWKYRNLDRPNRSCLHIERNRWTPPPFNMRYTRTIGSPRQKWVDPTIIITGAKFIITSGKSPCWYFSSIPFLLTHEQSSTTTTVAPIAMQAAECTRNRRLSIASTTIVVTHTFVIKKYRRRVRIGSVHVYVRWSKEVSFLI
jgi:hypothetical protein